MPRATLPRHRPRLAAPAARAAVAARVVLVGTAMTPATPPLRHTRLLELPAASTPSSVLTARLYPAAVLPGIVQAPGVAAGATCVAAAVSMAAITVAVAGPGATLTGVAGAVVASVRRATAVAVEAEAVEAAGVEAAVRLLGLAPGHQRVAPRVRRQTRPPARLQAAPRTRGP